MLINPQLVNLALEQCQPTPFEKYAQTVIGAVLGPKFKPLGGHKDGGADGFVDADLSEVDGKPTAFFQASKEINVEQKIKRTVERLKEFGREVKVLHYASSNVVPHIDKIENDLGDELDIRIKIYDRNYFAQHANHSADAVAAFEAHLRGAIAFDELKSPSYPSNMPIANAQAVCAFLGQELERRLGTVRTLEGVCDSLNIWALEDTAPEGPLMTEAEIITRVEDFIPTAKKFFRGQVSDRLKNLTKKVQGARKVNFHKPVKGYCLPYTTREEIQQTTIQDEQMKLDVTASFLERLETHGGNALKEKVAKEIPVLLHTILESIFSQQGYDISRHFLSNTQAKDDLNHRAIIEIAAERLKEAPIPKADHEKVLEIIKNVLRDVFYHSTPAERAYCSRLARTYMLILQRLLNTSIPWLRLSSSTLGQI